MGFFVHDDPEYREDVRMVGFNRYKQLLSFYGRNLIKVNYITLLGVLPFAAGATWSILSSSSLVMIASGILGGMFFGPFLAALYSSVMKSLMEAPGRFWDNYKKAWKLNLKGSLLPGAVLGLFTGMLIFMTYMMWVSTSSISYGTLALYAVCTLLFVAINTLLWPQLVLFEQTPLIRFRNIFLFGSKYLWKVLGVSLLQLVWIGFFVLFCPLTLLVLPFVGFWYIIFLSQLILYEDLNAELKIEELYGISRW